ncbi:DUF3144 domain-containing protein [Acinetobacter larvae]|uniref:DUF3144 domain-containing protein n=1 Tax=Acinetobacter larvae TaxID=1789224 RepID=A0A1B2M1A5_9GAMM|nr:DUF3144 domain-containing protein [Acinetobacter larvae]AOA58949.1 hypothetical protein BFG52_11715 [Acinetobacter larvae]
MSQKINATDVTEEDALNAVFFERADKFIQQANEFCRPVAGQTQTSAKPHEIRGQVSAAMLFATARFNTWVAANNFTDGDEMRAAKEQVMSYILQQFQLMLEDNYDEYCEQFENYLRFRRNEEFHSNKDHDHSHNH